MRVRSPILASAWTPKNTFEEDMHQNSKTSPKMPLVHVRLGSRFTRYTIRGRGKAPITSMRTHDEVGIESHHLGDFYLQANSSASQAFCAARNPGP